MLSRLIPQSSLALSAVLCIAAYELQAGLSRGKRRRANIDAEHVEEPQVLADTLMHHVLVNAPSSKIRSIRADWKVLVPEHAPNANDLDPLGLVRLNQKVVFHKQ